MAIRSALNCRLATAILALAWAAGSVGAATSAGGQASGLAEFVARLQQHYAATTSLSADFTQTLTSAGGPPRMRSGQIFYEKPARLRWVFAAPSSETIVSDGTTLYDYDPGLNQVVETPLTDAIKERSAAAFLLGVGNLERDFKIQELPAPSTEAVAHLVATPKEGGAPIHLDADRKTLNLVAVRIADALGNQDLVELKGIRRNIKLDAALFSFNPPAGADIVRAPPHS